MDQIIVYLALAVLQVQILVLWMISTTPCGDEAVDAEIEFDNPQPK